MIPPEQKWTAILIGVAIGLTLVIWVLSMISDDDKKDKK